MKQDNDERGDKNENISQMIVTTTPVKRFIEGSIVLNHRNADDTKEISPAHTAKKSRPNEKIFAELSEAIA